MKNGTHLTACFAALLSMEDAARAQLPMAERFDAMSPYPGPPALYGWFFQNNSSPAGTTSWFQGGGQGFPPFLTSGYLAADYHSTGGAGTISNWAITPVLYIDNGYALVFNTRTAPNPSRPERLQVRMSTAGVSVNVGASANDVGDFTTLLYEINAGQTTSGYPNEDWAGVSVVIHNLSGPTLGRLAFRYYVENTVPGATNADSIGIDEAAFGPPPALGVCCMPDGTCFPFGTEFLCASLGGVFHAAPMNCASAGCQPLAPGACCLEDGTCVPVTSGTCIARDGVFRGQNVACGAAGCVPTGYLEVGDAAAYPPFAPVVAAAAASPLTRIRGTFSAPDDVDVYKIYIGNRETFSAQTIFSAPGLDTQLFLFDQFGVGVTMDDDNSFGGESRITGLYAPSIGRYYLAVSQRDVDPVSSLGSELWADQRPFGGFYPEWQPNGPAATATAEGWIGTGGGVGAYTINLTGASFTSCPVNCDNSSVPPLLNVNDFSCFLNEWAKILPSSPFSFEYSIRLYVNFDGSTHFPLLTVNDFQRFLNAYAIGNCP